ncbi:MAG: hypothetical protein ACOH2F_13050 [Cellulomonas sp.]
MTDYLTTENVVFEVNAETRTIKGLVVPFGVTGKNGQGAFQFDADTDFQMPSDLSRLKLLVGHDFSKAVGYATAMDRTDKGIAGTFKVARGPEGDKALSMAEDRVLDGLSMGLGGTAKFVAKGGVLHGKFAPITEVSLTPIPAFDDSRVTSVAASAVTEGKEPDMGDNTPEVEAPGALDFTAIGAKVDDLAARFAAITLPPREVISATEGLTVTEAPLYRFDGGIGEHEFSTDLFNAIRFKDGEAKVRLDTFMEAQFAATATGGVASLNPVGYRPDLYVDSAVAATPVYDALNKGGLTNNTPFVVPKFGSSSNNVNDHVEGVEPTDAVFTATSQTVTPSAVSGQARLTREVVDAGGSPQVSGLIWTQMQRAYLAALETKSALLLTASAAAELGTLITAASVDGTLAGLLQANLALIPFIDGGEYFTTLVGHQDLYAALVAAKDTTGRPIFPQVAPSNANGTVSSKFTSVNVGGWNMAPAKSLGATTVNKKSYIFDPMFGGVWASNAQRIALPDSVATTANVGIFGYVGSAVLDATKIRKITYTK